MRWIGSFGSSSRPRPLTRPTQLLRNKRASDRAKDLADVEELEKIGE
jgi:hypothetical protein